MSMKTFEKALQKMTIKDWEWPKKPDGKYDYSQDMVEVKRPITSAIFKDAENGTLCLTTETGMHQLLDYYGEFRGGYPWINPEIEQLAEKHNVTIEWRDPGSIGFYD